MNVIATLCACAWLLAVSVIPAPRHPNAARVRWTTGHELRLLGFYVERQDARGWARLTPDRILPHAPGLVGEQQYHWLDRTTRCGVVYRYRVVAVGIDHTETSTEPATYMRQCPPHTVRGTVP